MSNTDPSPPRDDREPLPWRAIPLQPLSFPQALLVTALALGAAVGLRVAVLGLPLGWGISSTYFPALIVATLYAGPRWGWGSLVLVMLMSILAPWTPGSTLPRPATLVLFGLSLTLTVMVAGALRTALIRLRREGAARGEAEALLQLAENAGGLGLWDWDLDLGRAKWSPGVFENLGFSPGADSPRYDDLLGHVHPDDVERLKAANAEAIAGGRFYQIDYRAIGDDGQERWIHARGQVYRNAAGKAYRIVGYNLDVTERHRAAEQLRESEVRFRALADSAPALLWVSRLGGAREFVNAAYVAFIGGSYDDATSVDWRTRLHPDDLQRVLKEQVVGESSLKPFSLEARYRRADGQWRWLRSFSQPRFDPAGEFAGFAGIAFDVTEAKQVEADLQRINDLLEERVRLAMAERDEVHAQLIQSQKLEALGQLTGGVAHDFNNLLTVIIGALDIVQRHPEDTARTARLGKAALDAAQRGERLTRQLLAFSRRQPLRPEVARVDDLIREGEALYRRALGERCMLDLSLAGADGSVSIDAVQFDAAMMNLLVNARDAMGDGGVVCLTTAIVRRDGVAGDLPAGDYLAVSVQDTGEGMDEATRDRVFEPFFSTKPAGKGTGLGLSQVYGFVRQSGGGVTVDSAPGRGATITLLLPMTGVAPKAGEGARPATREPMRALNVLLVEDDPEVATLAEVMLRELGHEVWLAENPGEALILVGKDPRFNLLLTDVVMPGGLTGVDLARQATALRPGLPVLLSSGYTGEALASAEDAPWPLLRKPYTLDGLEAAIEEAVDSTARLYVEN